MPNRMSLEWLRRKRGLVLILAFVVSAGVIRPSDAHSMSIIALSMYLLFEVGLFFAQALHKK